MHHSFILNNLLESDRSFCYSSVSGGFVSNVFRFQFLPSNRSFIIKFPEVKASQDPDLEEFVRRSKLVEREIAFYERVARRLCSAPSVIENVKILQDRVICMPDLSPACAPVVPLSMEIATQAIEAIARVHLVTFKFPKDDQFEPIFSPGSWSSNWMLNLSLNALKSIKFRCGLSSSECARVRVLLEHEARGQFLVNSGDYFLCHGDFWVGNLLCSEEQKLVGVIDWQFSYRTRNPLVDLSLLMLSSGIGIDSSLELLSLYQKINHHVSNLNELFRLSLPTALQILLCSTSAMLPGSGEPYDAILKKSIQSVLRIFN